MGAQNAPKSTSCCVVAVFKAIRVKDFTFDTIRPRGLWSGELPAPPAGSWPPLPAARAAVAPR